jgi:hypothetical protein
MVFYDFMWDDMGCEVWNLINLINLKLLSIFDRDFAMVCYSV